MKKFNIPFGKPTIDSKEINFATKVLSQSKLVHGKVVEKFEQSFKKFVGSKYALSVGSCTAGMHLSYIALGVGKGDEVIVTSQTHVATAHTIEFVGATPIFVDCETNTGNINIDLIEQKITKKTKAISIVHFVGIPVNMEKLLYLKKKYKLFIIEECALALGSKIRNKHVGSIGDIGSFSFYPIKHITTIEGGMVTTNNKKTAEKIKRIRAFGYKREGLKSSFLYDVDLLGYNYRMNEIESAIGLKQMTKLKNILSKRKSNYNYYKKLFLENEYFTFLDTQEKSLINSYYCFTIILKKKEKGIRDFITNELKNIGIGCSVYYPGPVPLLSFYKKKYNLKNKNYSNASIISDHSISLPVGPHINKEMVEIIYKNLINILNKI